MAEWPGTLNEARRIQEEMAAWVVLSPLGTQISTVAGVDVAFSADRTAAAAVLYDLETMTCVEEATHSEITRFPYIPGYLSFREGPAMLAAIGKLHCQPDVIMVDGQGIAHPRRLGIASFLGVLLGKPAIGCAKSRLVGNYDEPPPEKGSWNGLYLDGELVGAVIRSRTGIKPLFVSPGHLVTLEESLKLVMECCTRYRLPEPVRHADALSKRAKLEIG